MTKKEETMLVFAARYEHNRQTGGALEDWKMLQDKYEGDQK